MARPVASVIHHGTAPRPLLAVQVNQQQGWGGGEVFAGFLTRHLAQLGVPSIMWVHPKANFWGQLNLPAGTVLCRTFEELLQAIDLAAYQPHGSAATPASCAGPRLWWLGHGPLPRIVLEQKQQWPSSTVLSAIAHMPVQGRDPTVFKGHDLIFAVSDWVRTGLAQAGLPVWPEPLYGVADLERFHTDSSDTSLHVDQTTQIIVKRSALEPDVRKPRDVFIKTIQRAALAIAHTVRASSAYHKPEGLVLGVVSRIATIKQFPQLFAAVLPVLLKHPQVHIELFGAGGYASLRDLRQVLKPLGGRVRFWGAQTDVLAVYQCIDALLVGLPEKEALGLNVLEATASGTPVLAVDAPPFTETIVDGVNGWLYQDPRMDGAQSFDRLIQKLLNQGPTPPHQEGMPAILAKFSESAFRQRILRILNTLATPNPPAPL